MTQGLSVPDWTGVGASLVLVALAAVIAYRQQLHLTRELLIASARAGVQLIAVGAILLILFRHTGYLTRGADPEDGRAQLLTATPAAHNLVTGLTSARIQRFAAAMEHLSPAQREAVQSGLDTLIDALDQ